MSLIVYLLKEKRMENAEALLPDPVKRSKDVGI